MHVRERRPLPRLSHCAQALVLPKASPEQEDTLALISTIHLQKSSWQAGNSFLQCELLLIW